jgi:hypothetical protein
MVRQRFATTGVLAQLAASVQAHWLKNPKGDIMAYLALWAVTAAASLIIIGIETMTRSRHIHSGFSMEMIHSAIEEFLKVCEDAVAIVNQELVPAFAVDGLTQLLQRPCGTRMRRDVAIDQTTCRGRYLLSVRGDTRIPSFRSSSLAIPHPTGDSRSQSA